MSSKQNRIQQYLKQYQLRHDPDNKRRFRMPSFKVILTVLIVAVIVYFGVQLYNAINQPLKTVTALQTTVYDEISTVGYFVRQEEVIPQTSGGILQYVVSEGEKIAQSALYANVYPSQDAAEATEKIRELDQRIQTLETALSYASDPALVSNTNTESLSSEIQSLLLSINEITDSGSLSLLAEPVDSLKHAIINRDFAFTSASAVEASVMSLKKERDNLSNTISNQEKRLFSPVAGFFSSSVDGYETILTPHSLSSMTLDEYQALENAPADSSDSAAGKVVTDFTWYFVTVLRSEDAARLSVGAKLSVQVDSLGETLIPASVSDIRRQNSEDVLVVLESNKLLSQMISLRRQSVRIILATYEGLKVPKSALRVNDSYQPGVYVITGMYAEFKPIEPVYESSEYYIVKTDPTTTKSLLVYDEIIVSGRGLENKKVIA